MGSLAHLTDGSAMRVPMEPEELVAALKMLAPGEFFRVTYPNPKVTPWWLNPLAVTRVIQE